MAYVENNKNLISEFFLTTDGDTYERRRDLAESKDQNYCICCGKAIKDFSKSHQVCWMNGGDYIGEISSDVDYSIQNDAGYMGYWSVGPTCYSRFRKLATIMDDAAVIKLATE